MARSIMSARPGERLTEPSALDTKEGEFDPRTEISADAAHIAQCAREDAQESSGRIVKHMWIIFVALPFVLGSLIMLLK